MSMNRELIYDFQVRGAQQALTDLRRMNQEFRQGKIGIDDWASAKKDARTASRNFADTFRLEQNLWLAAHPNVEKLTRAMSVFSSVMHTAMAIQNALNIAMLVTQGTSSQLASAEAEYAEAVRQRIIAEQSQDPIAIAEAREKEREALEKLKKMTEELEQAQRSQTLTFIISMATMVAVSIQTAIQILPQLGKVKNAFIAIKTAVLALNVASLANPYVLLALAIAAVATAIYALLVPAETLHAQLSGILGEDMATEILKWKDSFILVMSALSPLVLGIRLYQLAMEKLVPWVTGIFVPAMLIGFRALWNGMIGGFNSMLRSIGKGLEGLANMAVSAINGIIAGINKLVSWTGVSLSKISPITISVPQVPLASAATGFEGRLSKDTMFMAHRGEDVSITPAAQSGQGKEGDTYIFQVSGNMVTFRELLDEIDRHRERAIRDRGVRY